MLPLINSVDAKKLDEELKQIFISLYDNHIKKKERDLNVSGMAHLGSTEFLSRFVERDGLALINKGLSRDSLAYLYKSWTGRNPKAGLELLKTYLRFLYQDKAGVHQLWQDKTAPYPTKLSKTDTGNSFLTSRVLVELDPSVTAGFTETVEALLPAFRSIIGIQYLLSMDLKDDEISMSRPHHAEHFSIVRA